MGGPEVWRLQKICEQGLDPVQGGLRALVAEGIEEVIERISQNGVGAQLGPTAARRSPGPRDRKRIVGAPVCPPGRHDVGSCVGRRPLQRRVTNARLYATCAFRGIFSCDTALKHARPSRVVMCRGFTRGTARGSHEYWCFLANLGTDIMPSFVFELFFGPVYRKCDAVSSSSNPVRCPNNSLTYMTRSSSRC